MDEEEDLPGKRNRSLLYGQILTDVVITGENGTIDGQGSIWWDWFKTGELNYTRPHLVELMNSTGLIIHLLEFTFLEHSSCLLHVSEMLL
ncbi:probable polygalacturonase [Raphanus sativus]|uniref:Probable polygalacturonase n=1 Tax=Raphanus sativus TaxID=3726 RepID=A0A9W3CK57_RAPSA|nr:probable polygalacturonase [Raphanus sativus]XP_056851946.1 probable polygalacturonase [Raphanus sativus]XP_056851951.1 probable polygalacturonase [Raphanus sativus]